MKKGSEEGQPAMQEYELDVQLKRLAGKKGGAGLARVYAPRFPKVGLSVLYSLEYANIKHNCISSYLLHSVCP